MGQQEVLDILREHKSEWFTAKQISKFLEASVNSVSGNLRRLRQSNMVTFCCEGNRLIKYKWKNERNKEYI